MSFVPFGKRGGVAASLPEDWKRRNQNWGRDTILKTILNMFENTKLVHYIILRKFCSLALSAN
jgi:hypothetical protein